MCGDAGEAHPKLSPPHDVVFADRGASSGPFARRCGVGPDWTICSTIFEMCVALQVSLSSTTLEAARSHIIQSKPLLLVQRGSSDIRC